MEGYRRTLAKHRLSLPSGYIVDAGYQDETGHEAMGKLLRASPRPDGVFCYNDPVAIGAMRAISEAGLRVPDDIAVVGAGNVHYSDFLAVPLTTVDQGTFEIGKQAANLLLEQISSKRKLRPKKILIEPRLVIRESTEGRCSGLRTDAIASSRKKKAASALRRMQVDGSSLFRPIYSERKMRKDTHMRMRASVLAAVMAAVIAPSLLCGQDKGLASTPPMGWNSWNKFGCNVSEDLIRQMADAMVKSGMKDAGYQYVVIDDCWQVERDAERQHRSPIPSAFPPGSRRWRTTFIRMGLKFGIYSDAGTMTCAEASRQPGPRVPGRAAVRRLGCRLPEVRLVQHHHAGCPGRLRPDAQRARMPRAGPSC